MSKLAVPLAVAACAVALAPPARAQAPAGASAPPLLSASVSPSAGASARKPRSATVRLALDVPPALRATVTSVTFRLPAHVRLSGAGFAACPAALVAGAGEAGCPAGSRAGSLLASADLGTSPAVSVAWTANVYVASATALTVVLKGLVPAVVEARVTGGGRRLTLELPGALRAPLGGLSASTTGIAATLGATRVAGKGKKRRTYRLAKLTGCPKDRRHRFAATVVYAGGGAPPPPLTATAPCRPR